MKPRGSVQLTVYPQSALRERIRTIATRTKMKQTEVIEFAMARVKDEEFVKTERQVALPFGRKRGGA
jgi:hypothetical protein